MSEALALCDKGLGNVIKVKESVALKELRFMWRLICRHCEKGKNHLSLCVLAMKA